MIFIQTSISASQVGIHAMIKLSHIFFIHNVQRSKLDFCIGARCQNKYAQLVLP